MKVRAILLPFALAIISVLASPPAFAVGRAEQVEKAGWAGSGAVDISREPLAPCAAVFAQQAQKLCLQIAWLRGPVNGAESQALLSFFDAQSMSPQAPPSAPKLALWMPDMGHGSSPTSVSKTVNAHVFQVNRIYFVMPGHWELRVAVGREIQSFPVKVP